MKSFVWRLQRVLDIKIKEEQVKRAQLLEITEKLTHAQTELFMQKRILAEAIKNFSKEEPKKRLERQELFLKSAAVNEERIKGFEKKVADFTKLQKEKINEVVKIKKFRKSLERLREEKKLEFIKEQEKIEQRQTDEITTISFSRKIMEAAANSQI
jgi:flagellar FliJ protein